MADKISFEAPRGMRDFYPEDMAWRNRVFGAFRAAADAAGFEPYDACVVESFELLARKAGEEENFPFIAVSPVTPKAGWEPDSVIEFLDRLLADRRFRFKIDPTRVYLTGFSMGGYGTFQTASRYPERFAAAVPLAGGSPPDDPETLRDIPIWAFHGDEDDVTSLENTRKAIETLTALGNRDARLTELQGYGHMICENVYSRPELYRWMLHKRLPRRRGR